MRKILQYNRYKLRKFFIYKNYYKYYKSLPGNYCEGATPDPIPNSEVKSFSADGTLS